MTLPPDLEVRAPGLDDAPSIAALVAACDETYRAWTPPGWEPPAAGSELDRWRGRLTDGSSWARVATEPDGRIVGLVCFTQAMREEALPPAAEGLPAQHVRTFDPLPGRAHVSAVFTHPDRWRQGIAAELLALAEDAMREQGYREVQLWTPKDAPARRFYEATGWIHDGRETWLAELELPLVAYVKPL